jgi:hypothetical protein
MFIFISDKIDVRPKLLKKTQWLLYNDKRENSARRCSNCKYVFTHHLNTLNQMLLVLDLLVRAIRQEEEIKGK